MSEKSKTHVDVVIKDERYSIEFNDIDGVEARAFRQKVGMPLTAALETAGSVIDVIEVVAGIKWLIDRRKDPDADFDKVLASLTYNDFEFTDHDEGTDARPPDSGGDSETPSPPSLISSTSDLGS